ncbi:hypothetical protein H5410_063569 [Solanum commersonii]|uniref:DUF4216 domain-containing protein n=1 Tax=Solanum commersonii TaxID=4109 RepID=A0A9J5WDK8_SOLCO|nr:hypothetical protein H5410_063569 [Solanum commersonii]
MEGGDSRSYWSRKSKDDTKHEIDKEGCLFPTIGKSYGSVEVIKLDQKTWMQAHRYVLFNCESDVVDYYKNEHISEIKRLHRKRCLTQHQLNRLHFENFHEWFKEQLSIALWAGPCYFARRFKAFHMNNGYRFRTKQYEEFMQTQNSGVLVVSMTESYASTTNSAPKSGNITYYGRLNDIVELNYYEKFKVVLFKCDWVDELKVEDDEPFVFAGQAQQVIFVQDPEDHEWFVPRSIKPRDIFDKGEESKNIRDLEDDNNGWVRGGVDGIEIGTD